jgi:2,4-dienoyl-CoA reductase-like NADH-dependent reductase (Old Yellow Enzyme family)
VTFLTSLLDPLTVGKLHLKNRIVMPPMASELATKSGEITDALVTHYRSHSKSVGLVIVEHNYIDPAGKLSEKQPGIHSDTSVAGLSRIAEAVHREGAAVAIQINHAGRRANPAITGAKPVAPSPFPDPDNKEIPHELTGEEIQSVVRAFGLAAIRAVKAGFDAVEIHGAHGFLLSQFCSPITNKRTDRYGGTLENRMRFPLEVASEILRTVGTDLPVLYRLGADDMMPGGLTLEDSKRIAMSLADSGIAIIDVSGGLCGSRPPNLSGQGYFTHLAKAIKQTVKIPVITTGGIKTPQYADELIKTGIADLVGVGRTLTADPDWASRAVEALKK